MIPAAAAASAGQKFEVFDIGNAGMIYYLKTYEIARSFRFRGS